MDFLLSTYFAKKGKERIPFAGSLDLLPWLLIQQHNTVSFVRSLQKAHFVLRDIFIRSKKHKNKNKDSQVQMEKKRYKLHKMKTKLTINTKK